MITYIDTSVLVKLLVEEPGSDDAALRWTRADRLASVALVEVRVMTSADRDLSAAAARRGLHVATVGVG